MKLWKILVAVVPFVCVDASAAFAQHSADNFKETIASLTETAERLCGVVSQSGSSSSVKVEGNVKAELSGLAKKLANLGISGTGTIVEESYEGVIRDQLAEALKDERQCKKIIFVTLLNKLMPDLTQPRPDYKPVILAIASLIDEGQQIANNYLTNKNVNQFIEQYQAWFTKTDGFLRQKLDASYATQFNTAPPSLMSPTGIDPTVTGYWQHLLGNLNVLNLFITELNRASQ